MSWVASFKKLLAKDAKDSELFLMPARQASKRFRSPVCLPAILGKEAPSCEGCKHWRTRTWYILSEDRRFRGFCMRRGVFCEEWEGYNCELYEREKK